MVWLLRDSHHWLLRQPINWVLDLDVVRCFDSFDRTWLERFLQHRIGDRQLLRLIHKWLKAGVLEGEVVSDPDRGVVQGAVISPLLSNVYLHYALDLWVHQWRRRHAQGVVIMTRYADDAVVGFQYRQDAERFLATLTERLATFAL